jgi:expansin (peptidoglycan-binding protein)
MVAGRPSLVSTLLCALALTSSGCGSDSGSKTGSKEPGPPTTTGASLGDAHEGLYHLGPVDFAETQYHNACAPGGMKYRADLQDTVGLGGEYLAGVSNAFNLNGGVCDACILIETGKGKSIVARVVTYGVEHADGDIDVSPSVFDAIYQNEEPRNQTWHFTRCPDEGNLQYEFQTASNPYWTSLWIRNPLLPIAKAEVKTSTGKDFMQLNRAGDGTLTDPSGFGNGAFTLRITAVPETGTEGQVITDDQPGFTPGALVKSNVQFQ